MHPKIIFSFLTILLIFSSYNAYGQQPKLATFHETAQVIVDQHYQNKISTSIAVISTSIQEIRVPVELEQKILDMKNVTAVVITNEEQCVLGVVDQTCILINLPREGFSGGIKEAQSKGKEVGDLLIDDINNAFKLDAKFHSVFIHVDDKINKELETTGIISGRGTISAVYTMPKSDTSYLYEKLSTILLPKQILNSGGFLDVAKKITDDPTSSVTFSIMPKGGISYFQLQVSRDYPIKKEVTSINTLELLGTEKLERSKYFGADFYPLNSIVQVVALSNETMKFSIHGSQLVPTVEKDGSKFPSDLTKNGWLFDPEVGDTIVGKYLFGKTLETTKDDLKLTIQKSDKPVQTGNENTNVKQPVIDNNSIYVLVGIGAAAVIAIMIYLKKPKKSLEN